MTPLAVDHALFRFAGFVLVAGAVLILSGALLVRVYVAMETNFGVPL